MSAYIGDQVAEPFAFVIPCDLVMRVTEDPLDGIRPRTVRRKPQQFEARMSVQPTLDGLRFVNFVVIHDYIDVGWRPHCCKIPYAEFGSKCRIPENAECSGSSYGKRNRTLGHCHPAFGIFLRCSPRRAIRPPQNTVHNCAGG